MNLLKTAPTAPALTPALMMAGPASGSRLQGRRGERELLDRLIADVRAGQSRILVLHGEPGTGKTALLDYLTQRAGVCRVARVT
ncbi:MAG TPA: ATP-binding protein, partial [Streptosporangiaceae bacterium]